MKYTSAGSTPRPKKNHDTLHNEEWLRLHYLDLKLSMRDIAKMVGTTPPSVKWAMEKFGIQARRGGEAKKGRSPSVPVWTPERRAALAEKRRGAGNPMFGKANLSRRGPNYHPDRLERQVRSTRASRYGLSGPAYDELLKAQGGVCAICKQPERVALNPGDKPHSLAVDHDHATLKVRGLLCRACNVGLGNFADDPALLRTAADYLERG